MSTNPKLLQPRRSRVRQPLLVLVLMLVSILQSIGCFLQDSDTTIPSRAPDACNARNINQPVSRNDFDTAYGTPRDNHDC